MAHPARSARRLQVAAQALNVPLSKVFISETSTDKVPNASPTAASASSDMYGGAVLDACRQLNERLAPYRCVQGCPGPLAAAAVAARALVCRTCITWLRVRRQGCWG